MLKTLADPQIIKFYTYFIFPFMFFCQKYLQEINVYLMEIEA